MKTCTKCGMEKPLSEFYKNSSKKNRYNSECKKCTGEARHIYYIKNREKITERERKRMRDNSELNKIRCREYYNAHKETLNKKNREYYADNKKTISEQKREYYRKNKARIDEYREKNKEHKAMYDKAYIKNKLLNDELYAFKYKIRHAINRSFKRAGFEKNCSTEKILGCSLKEFKEYLLATWEKNYGTKWNGEPYHIDHIIPLATAKTKEQVLKLCSYTNLQMLTPKDNLKKGANYAGD